MMLPVVLVQLLPRIKMRAAELAVVFVSMCHIPLR